MIGPAQVDPGSLASLRLDGPEPDFTPQDLLGRGGMGEVRSAVDHTLRREVALKTVARGVGCSSAALLQEALFTGYLEHPNIVPVHRLGTDGDGQPAFVMKRVVGTSWRDLLRDPDHPGWAALADDRLRANLEILGDVCNAVHFAHSRGVLHRDVKPANVMVGEFGEVYLVDWGLAIRLDRLEQAPDSIVGTLAYMAPEMLEEPTELSERTDVYLLGATLHEVLSGKPRHDGSAHYNVMLSVYRSDPQDFPVTAPRELTDLCNQATARDPSRRPASALELKRALERYLEHRGSIALAERAAERLAVLEQEAKEGAEESRLATLLAECRFGFEQALHTWPENPSAQAGLQRCLEGAIERAFAAKDRGLVVSLLPALPERKAEFDDRLAALTEELAAAAEAPARLKELEQDLDFRIGSRERAKAIMLLFALGFLPLLLVPVLYHQHGMPLTPGTTLGMGLTAGAVLLGVFFLGRDALLANRANRRLVQMTAAGWLGGMVYLGFFWVYPIPVWVVLLDVGFLLTFFGMQLAVVVDPRFWIPAIVGSIACYAGVIWPNIDPFVMTGFTGGVMLALIAWLWFQDEPEPPDSAG